MRFPGNPQKSVFMYKAKLLDRPQAMDSVRLPAKKIKKDLLVMAIDISLNISFNEIGPLHVERSLIYFVVDIVE